MAMLNNQRVMNCEELMIQIWQFWGFSHDWEEHLAVQHYNGDLDSLDTNKKWDMDEPTSTWFRCECGQIYKTLGNCLFGCNRRVKGYWFGGDKWI